MGKTSTGGSTEMPISFDNILGIHERALMLRARRSEVLASNLANADTPGYKARDIDFKATLEQSMSTQQGAGMNATHAGHFTNGAGGADGELLYRNPTQPSIDGNTVDSQVEKSKFAENALQYQASLSFIDGRLKGLMAAIRGE
jgi:flagellar basal-body rod protein FlgB